MDDNKSIWSLASAPAIALGAVSIVYVLLGWLMSEFIHSGIVTGLLSFVFWVVKFAFCLALMKYFLQKFSIMRPSADNRDVFRYGMALAALSALLYSAFYLAYVLFLVPEQMAEAFDTAIGQYSSMLDSSSLSMLENMESSMPQIYFFTNLIYCFLFGTVLSAIYSRNIPPRNPFGTPENPAL